MHTNAPLRLQEWKAKEMLLLTRIVEDVKREARIEEQRRRNREESDRKVGVPPPPPTTSGAQAVASVGSEGHVPCSASPPTGSPPNGTAGSSER